MLKVVVPDLELLNETTSEFVYKKGGTLLLEHSLISVSKWEAKWHQAYLDPYKEEKTMEENLDYIRCMTINQGVDPEVYQIIPAYVYKQIQEYVRDPMTGTKIRRPQTKPGPKQIVSSEQIYSWMAKYGIPFECEKWHLNRLMTLIEVCAANNGPAQKMTQAEIMKENAAINAARRGRLHKKH